MKLSRSVSRYILIAAFTGASGAAFAQDQSSQPVGHDVQRDTSQQERIEQGLKSGQLTPQEASQLERQESHVDTMEQRDLRNGNISPAEQHQLNKAQNGLSREINGDTHNNVTGNPDSLNSQRMQTDVHRDAEQEQRIQNGVQNGTLSNGEVRTLEGGQKEMDRAEGAAAGRGGISTYEQQKITQGQQSQSERIHSKRHNDRDRPEPQH